MAGTSVPLSEKKKHVDYSEGVQSRHLEGYPVTGVVARLVHFVSAGSHNVKFLQLQDNHSAYLNAMKNADESWSKKLRLHRAIQAKNR